MAKFCLMVIALTTAAFFGCSDAPVEYATENSGGTLHWISTDPIEVFRHKVDHEADIEARGITPPVGNASWQEYWMKMIAYWTDQGTVGGHNEVVTYIVQQRRARGLPRLYLR